MRMRGWLLVPMLALGMGIVSCGGHTKLVVPPVEPGAALVGNWRLFGSGALQDPPALSLTIQVTDGQLQGQSILVESCTDHVGMESRSIPLSGQVAADGSFQMTNSVGGLPTILMKGHVPAKGDSSWIGSYAVKGTASGFACTVQDQRTFTAARSPAVHGVYAGKLNGAAWADGRTLSMTIAQGTPGAFSLSGGFTRYATPLAGTVDLSGKTCFSNGTTAGSLVQTPAGRVTGNAVALNFEMNDGSTLVFDGYFTDLDEKSLHVDVVDLFAGKCQRSSAEGVLTLQ